MTEKGAIDPHKPYKSVVPWTIASALFMETLDGTILNVAIPNIATTFGIGPLQLKLAVTCYLMTLAILIPISGWLADKVGCKKVYLTGVAIFTIGSLFCGLSQNLPQLIITRIVQGIGGAMMMPVGRLIIVRSVKINKLIDVARIVTIPALIGPMLGPVIGGYLTTYFNWRYIFLVNIPFGILNFSLAALYFKENKLDHVPPFDLFGFITFGGGLACLAYTLDNIGNRALYSLDIIICFIAGILGLVFFIQHARQQPDCMIDTRIFHHRTFRLSIIGTTFVRIGFSTFIFLLPIMLQISFHLSAFQAGVTLLPLAIGAILAKVFARNIINVFGFRNTLIFGTILIAILMNFMVFIHVHTALYTSLIIIFFSGVIGSLLLTTTNVLAYVECNHREKSAATSIMSTAMQFSFSLGVACSALIIELLARTRDISHILSSTHFYNTYVIMSIFPFIGAMIFSLLHSSDGSEARSPVQSR